jgi:ubiquinone/menaquinone biosynthesis C-methylase UbiE
MERVLKLRTATSQRFFATSAGQWDLVRDELFGRDFLSSALLSLLDDTWVIGDLGCGTGVATSALAPHVGRVIGVDASEEMLASAKTRSAGHRNIEWRVGSLEALPLKDATLDAAVMMLVLHHVPSPVAALTEARRALKPGGRLLIVDMTTHHHEVPPADGPRVARLRRRTDAQDVDHQAGFRWPNGAARRSVSPSSKCPA